MTKIHLSKLHKCLGIASSRNLRRDLSLEIYDKITIENVDYYIGKVFENKNMIFTGYKLFIGIYDPETCMIDLLPDLCDNFSEDV
jgi:hypothetical protein